MAPIDPAAVGFRSHSGWAALICLAGPVQAPIILARQRLLLTSAPLPCEPYHSAKGDAHAEQIVQAAADEARTLAVEAIKSLTVDTRARRFEITGGAVLLGAGRPDFTLPAALSSHAGMHNAEGWLFREALLSAGGECGLQMIGVPEVEVYPAAAAAVGLSIPSVRSAVTGLRAELGPPWTADEKLAAAAAWLALAASDAASGFDPLDQARRFALPSSKPEGDRWSSRYSREKSV